MFFFRSQFSFWAFPHQSLCLCCPGARLQRKGEAVPFFSSFIAKLCRLFSNIPKGRSLYNHLVGCRSVSRRHHNFLLFLLCSCLHPLSTKCFLSPNILVFFLLSSSSLPPTKYFLSTKIKISKRVLHCFLGLFFIQVFNTNHIPFMSALVNYGAVVMLMQVLQFNENSSPSLGSTNT